MISIDKLYSLFLDSDGVSTDSRKIEKGCLYIALKGDNFDGNDFALESIAKGAKYALVSNESLVDNIKIFYSEDTLSSLQRLAEFHRKKFTIPVIGLTGTNGKTTTKELITKVLQQKYKVCSTQGNLNNHIGVPLTLLNINSNTEIAVIEMGAGGLHEISTLVNIAHPTHGLITNIGKAHLLGFKSVDGVKKTKGELYDYLISSNGTIFYNSDDNVLIDMIAEKGAKSIVSYSKDNTTIETSNTPFLQFKINEKSVNTKLIGQYNINNILAAICIGQYFDIEEDLAIEAIESYNPSNNRSQFLETANNSIVIDAYNANPVSMEASIINFSKIDRPNKVYILGDMLELGEDSLKEHYNIYSLLSKITTSDDTIYLVGDQFKSCLNETHIKENFKHFNSNLQLKDFLINNPINNSFILIKGSRGIKLEVTLECL